MVRPASFRPFRAPAVLCCILAAAASARGAGSVLKIDDTVLTGDVISFDGNDLQVRQSDQRPDQTGPGSPLSIPIRDIVRVRFQGVPLTPDRDPGTPKAPQATQPPRTPPARVPGGANADPGPAPAGAPALPPAPPIRLPPYWQVKLAGGDVISGTLRSWSQDQVGIDHQQVDATFRLPAPFVHEVWRVAPDLVRGAVEMKISSDTEDVAYVLKDHDVVAVKGRAVGVEDGSLGFVYEGRQRKIGVDRVLGVVLAPQRRSAATRPAEVPAGAAAVAPGGAQVVHVLMLNGDRLSGRWTLLKDGMVSLQTPWNETLRLPAAAVSGIEVSNRRVVFLSELKPVRVEQTPYFDRVVRWRADASLDGGPLRLNDGRQYARGVAMHSRCVLEYDLDAGFEQFQARLGFEPTPPNSPPGRVAARVLVDGKPAFEDEDVRGDDKPRDLVLGIRGAKRLAVEVDFGKDQDVNDRVVWANARLIRTGGDQ